MQVLIALQFMVVYLSPKNGILGNFLKTRIHSKTTTRFANVNREKGVRKKNITTAIDGSRKIIVVL
jgi:hypothetical protein